MNKAIRNILFVDDDPVVLTLYRNRLQREGFQIEVARDGQEALNMLPEVRPDLVVLDLMLPEVNGIEVLKFIRGHAELKSVPVLVLSNAYMTELANKAMKAGANKGILKNQCNPTRLAGIIRDMLGGAPVPEPAPSETKFYSGRSQAQTYLAAAAAAHADEMSLKTTRSEFLRQAAGEITTIRDLCLAYIKNCNSPEGKQRLNTLYQRIHFLSARAGLAGCTRVALLASAFEAVLFDIVFRPANATASVMQTIAQAVDALGRLFQHGDVEGSGLNLAAKILVVDDDAVCNHAMVSALKRAHLDPVSTEDPKVALQLLETGRFDIVLLDINMPQMNGFELCEALRRLPHCKNTPVIFITGNGDFQNRARSVLSGGDDLITKPTSPLELVLKTTMYLLHANVNSGSAERKNIIPDEALFSEVLRVGSTESQHQDQENGSVPAAPPEPQSQPLSLTDTGDIFKPTAPTANSGGPAKQMMPGTGAPSIETPAQQHVSENLGDPAENNEKIEAPDGLIGFDEPLFVRALEPTEAGTRSASTGETDVHSSIPELEPAPSAPAPAVALPPQQSSPAPNSFPAMQNKYSQAFDEVSHEVARIIFGEENLTELNVRLARIALERYNVHEIINRLADANDSNGRASRLTTVSV